MRRGLVLLLFLLAGVGRACMWDTDTLAEEASLGKDFIATITGRFPRNPPLFYTMRRDRLLAKSARTPSDYDDIAVAYERLGDSLSALRWIDRKPKGTAEDEYRTHANRGTFLIHAWLKGLKDVRAGERGLHELEKALSINPDAHFGRERVQIRLVKELLEPSGMFEADKDALRGAEGFAGIVRLGSGWESPDVFRALAVDLASYRGSRPRLGAVASLALLRADELERSGHKAKLPQKDYFASVTGSQWPDLASSTRREFIRLRREADDWQTRRTAYMAERLKAGRHPDTDPAFWSGWTDGPVPAVHDTWIERNNVEIGTGLIAAVLLAVVALPTMLLYLLARTVRRRWARSEKSQRSPVER